MMRLMFLHRKNSLGPSVVYFLKIKLTKTFQKLIFFFLKTICNHYKTCTKRSMPPKDAVSLANSSDPDQTAPSRSILS